MSTIVKISEAASLGLHTMVFLAKSGEELASTREIATALQVSEAHLSKVLQRLVRVGLVKSVRGPKGGFLLARSGDEMTLLDVYEAIDGPLEPVNCLLGTPTCRGSACILGGVLQTVNDQVREYLAGTKLSELVNVYRSKHEYAQENSKD